MAFPERSHGSFDLATGTQTTRIETVRLPEAATAVVEPAKVRDYLLSPEHPVGRYKATFFASLGYTRSDWHHLRDDLLRLVVDEDAVPGRPSDFGAKYEVRGSLQGLLGGALRSSRSGSY